LPFLAAGFFAAGFLAAGLAAAFFGAAFLAAGLAAAFFGAALAAGLAAAFFGAAFLAAGLAAAFFGAALAAGLAAAFFGAAFLAAGLAATFFGAAFLAAGFLAVAMCFRFPSFFLDLFGALDLVLRVVLGFLASVLALAFLVLASTLTLGFAFDFRATATLRLWLTSRPRLVASGVTSIIPGTVSDLGFTVLGLEVCADTLKVNKRKTPASTKNSTDRSNRVILILPFILKK
jgi:hypothetical protein